MEKAKDIRKDKQQSITKATTSKICNNADTNQDIVEMPIPKKVDTHDKIFEISKKRNKPRPMK